MASWSGLAAFMAAAVLADGILCWMHRREWIYYEGLAPLVWSFLRPEPRPPRR